LAVKEVKRAFALFTPIPSHKYSKWYGVSTTGGSITQPPIAGNCLLERRVETVEIEAVVLSTLSLFMSVCLIVDFAGQQDRNANEGDNNENENYRHSNKFPSLLLL
jgi:hypothetical protein